MAFWRKVQHKFWLVVLMWNVSALEVAHREEDYHLDMASKEGHAFRLITHYEAAKAWCKKGDKLARRIQSVRGRFDDNLQLVI